MISSPIWFMYTTPSDFFALEIWFIYHTVKYQIESSSTLRSDCRRLAVHSCLQIWNFLWYTRRSNSSVSLVSDLSVGDPWLWVSLCKRYFVCVSRRMVRHHACALLPPPTVYLCEFDFLVDNLSVDIYVLRGFAVVFIGGKFWIVSWPWWWEVLMYSFSSRDISHM